MWSVLLATAFYVALVPVLLYFSGPIYRALECTFGDCASTGTEVRLVLPKRSRLRVGSPVRLPSGDVVGEIVGFERGSTEQYTIARGVIADENDALVLFGAPLRCAVEPNLSIQTDADLVLANCPGEAIDNDNRRPGELPTYVCGSVDHFERIGQELRRFVLENVRPGEVEGGAVIAGPCGADNERETRRLVGILEAGSGAP